MKLDQVLEWVGKSPANQLIVGAVAVVLLLLIFFIFRRRSEKAKAAAKATARGQAVKNDLKDVFDGYRESHPAFHGVMTQIQAEQRLDEFMSNNEFAGAIAKLRLWQTVRLGIKPGKQTGASPLTIQPAPSKSADPEVRAAMITVLRVLYASPQISSGLTPGTEKELDKLLESLTG